MNAGALCARGQSALQGLYNPDRYRGPMVREGGKLVATTWDKAIDTLVAKLGEAWDEDPRIFAVQMGLIGHFGEHHNPAPTAEQRRLLTEAFQKAFKHKPVLVRHNDPEFMQAGFGIYYDTFANLSREPPDGPQDQFPWQATHVYRETWKRAPIEGEVEYNWQKQRESAKPAETFGRTPNETMTVPAYRSFMIDKTRRYHASYLGWISNYDATDSEVLAGAAELQKAFGYRLVLDAASEILGVHIIGPHATDLIAEACAAVRAEMAAEGLFRTNHAHPTLSEAVMEAAHASHGAAIHS